MKGSSPTPNKRILAGRYELQHIAGKGGMGVVWRAWDVSVQRQVAIKLVLPAHNDEEQQQRLARIRRERDVLIDLAQHPNIVTLFDLLTEPLGYVMEWLDGFNLEQWLQINPGPQSLHTIAAIFSPILDAVGFAHERGIVHRDLKSSNVFLQLLGDRATLRVMDYGLARIVEQESNITTGRLIVGTPQYMAPEQVLGTESSAQTDIYALGVLLFECVTGQLPHQDKGESPIPLLVSKINDEVPRARAIRPDISEALDEVIARAMQRQPEHRFSSCEEFADALFDAIPDLPKNARSSIQLDTLGNIPAPVAPPATAPGAPFPSGTLALDRELYGEPRLPEANDADTVTSTQPTTKTTFATGERDEQPTVEVPAVTAEFFSEDTRKALHTLKNSVVVGTRQATQSAVERIRAGDLFARLLPGSQEVRSTVSIAAGILLGLVASILVLTWLMRGDKNADTSLNAAQTSAVFPDVSTLTDDAPILVESAWLIEGQDLNTPNVRGALRTYERVIKHWNQKRHAYILASHRSPLRCYYNQVNLPREELPQDPLTRALLGRPNSPITPTRIVVTGSGRDYVTFVEEGLEGREQRPYTRMIQMAGSNRSHWLVSVEVSEDEHNCFERFDAQWKTYHGIPRSAVPIAPVAPPTAP